MHETLRLAPPASQRAIAAYEDTVIKGGKYFIPKTATVAVNVFEMHRDPKVWGEDVSIISLVHSLALADLITTFQGEDFRPERMLDGKFEALPVRIVLFSLLEIDDILTKSHFLTSQPNAWQPFGFGMRGCIVRTNNMLMTKLTLA